MQSASAELAEPQMHQLLVSLGVDVEYVRAEGNTLYLLDGNGAEVPVLDYAGGYGALILGHNHPAVVDRAREFLDAGTPVLAQASRQPLAGRVAARLNTVLHREFDTAEPYYAVFSNSGAESIEVAIKHAEFDRVLRIAALRAEIAAHVEEARAAVLAGTAGIAPGARAAAGVGADRDFDAVVGGIAAHNDELAARPPVFLALEGSFHGKLAGSVQLTHNASFRTPFAAMAAPARFVPFDQPDQLVKVIADHRATALDVVVTDGVVDVVERAFPVFGAFLLEVIQGEGGIRVVSREFAARIQEACAAVDCPIVVDEIQSGMGRTGAFFASAHIGLRADYYALAKSLGGGLVKTAVTLVREGRYRPEFELVHSSTFAKDTFSCAIALTVLDLLEADDGRVYRLAAYWGERLTALFTALRRDFPDVVVDVRGRGLMLGLEFRDQSESTSPGIRQVALADSLGYVVSGHLLRHHRIRTFPTASAVNTLRFEPSVLLTDEEVDRLDVALRAVCGVLRDQDELRLFS
ncbi:aminotransferase class III-fold pyridoxal phosphate-dependent enzyme [Actinosynnema sp. NPDC020468]|uniref:aspartate aminotransferase family protein n=1 Tax=Actinosynnema sp. NPDC020468 TaxID=3154488 RepID=UPI0033EA0D7D